MFGHDRFGVPMSHLQSMVYFHLANRDASHGLNCRPTPRRFVCLRQVHWNKVGMDTNARKSKPASHQRCEINAFCIVPQTRTVTQVCYEWALSTKNKGVTITVSKSPLPIHTTFAQTREGI
jgi:hypothetical protein